MGDRRPRPRASRARSPASTWTSCSPTPSATTSSAGGGRRRGSREQRAGIAGTPTLPDQDRRPAAVPDQFASRRPDARGARRRARRVERPLAPRRRRSSSRSRAWPSPATSRGCTTTRPRSSASRAAAARRCRSRATRRSQAFPSPLLGLARIRGRSSRSSLWDTPTARLGAATLALVGLAVQHVPARRCSCSSSTRCASGASRTTSLIAPRSRVLDGACRPQVIGTWRRTFGATRSRISERLSPVHVRPWLRRPITACAGSGSCATRSATATASCCVPHG